VYNPFEGLPTLASDTLTASVLIGDDLGVEFQNLQTDVSATVTFSEVPEPGGLLMLGAGVLLLLFWSRALCSNCR